MKPLKDQDRVDWNDPFEGLLARQDERVRDEEYVILGQSIISTKLVDRALWSVLVAAGVLSWACEHFGQPVSVFTGDWVWGEVWGSIVGTTVAVWVVLAVTRCHGPTVRIITFLEALFMARLVGLHASDELRPYALQTGISLVVFGVALLSGPLYIAYLESDYAAVSFKQRMAIARHQTDLLSDIIGKNIRKIRLKDLGKEVRSGYRRVKPEDRDLLQIGDFRGVFADKRRRKEAFLLFAAGSKGHVSKRKFLDTVSDIYHEWYQVRQSMTRSSSMFVVLAGLLDIMILALASMFSMAAFGFSILHMITAALFVYGIINNFFGEAILHWKFGTYFVLGVHPYDIGDTVIIPDAAGSVTLRVVDFTLTTSLLKRIDGQFVTIPHRTIAYSVVQNLSRNRKNRVVLTLSADEAKGLPILDIVRRILRDKVPDYFLEEFKISRVPGTQYSVDVRPKIELTFAFGLNMKQRVRGLVIMCSQLREAALEAEIEQEE